MKNLPSKRASRESRACEHACQSSAILVMPSWWNVGSRMDVFGPASLAAIEPQGDTSANVQSCWLIRSILTQTGVMGVGDRCGWAMR